MLQTFRFGSARRPYLFAVKQPDTELFPVDVMTQRPAARNFVFEGYDPSGLFEANTGLYPDVFVDAVVWRNGFSGTEQGRATLVAFLVKKLLDLFIEDETFAERVGFSEDPRPELEELLRRWIAEEGAAHGWVPATSR